MHKPTKLQNPPTRNTKQPHNRLPKLPIVNTLITTTDIISHPTVLRSILAQDAVRLTVDADTAAAPVQSPIHLLFNSCRLHLLSLLLLQPSRSFRLHRVRHLANIPINPTHHRLRHFISTNLIAHHTINGRIHFRTSQRYLIFRRLTSVLDGAANVTSPVHRTLQPLTRHVAFTTLFKSITDNHRTPHDSVSLLVINRISFSRIITTARPLRTHLNHPVGPSVFAPRTFTAGHTSPRSFISQIVTRSLVPLLKTPSITQWSNQGKARTSNNSPQQHHAHHHHDQSLTNQHQATKRRHSKPLQRHLPLRRTIHTHHPSNTQIRTQRRATQAPSISSPTLTRSTKCQQATHSHTQRTTQRTRPHQLQKHSNQQQRHVHLHQPHDAPTQQPTHLTHHPSGKSHVDGPAGPTCRLASTRGHSLMRLVRGNQPLPSGCHFVLFRSGHRIRLI